MTIFSQFTISSADAGVSHLYLIEIKTRDLLATVLPANLSVTLSPKRDNKLTMSTFMIIHKKKYKKICYSRKPVSPSAKDGTCETFAIS